MDTNIDRLLGYLTLDIVDLKYLDRFWDVMPRYLYLGMDLLSCWVYAEFQNFRSPLGSKLFLERLIADTPFSIKKIFTDNAIEFTDSTDPLDAEGKKKETFGQVCVKQNIVHVQLRYEISDLCGHIENQTHKLVNHDYWDTHTVNTFDDYEKGLKVLVNDVNEEIKFDRQYLTGRSGSLNAYFDHCYHKERRVLKEMVEAWDAYFDPTIKDWSGYLQYLKSQVESTKISESDD